MIHRAVMALRPRQPWKSEGGVDRVVDRGPSVAVTGDDDHDQVTAQLRQLGVRAPLLDRQIGEHDPSTLARRRDQTGHLALTRLASRVDHHRALALVEAGPVEAAAAMQRPAVDIDSSAGWIDPDHVGAERRQGGADVIRVDPPGGGIDIDRWPLHRGRSLYWAGLNQGKRSVVIDTRSEAGQRQVAGLIAAPGEGGGIVLTNLPVKK